MIHPFRTLCLPLLCLVAALPAQDRGGKPKGSDRQKQEAGEDVAKARKTAREQEKKDPVMAKDPAILAIDKFLGRNKVDTSRPDWRTKLVQPPLLPFDSKSEYFWNVETSKGLIVVKLFPDTAPMHVTNGIYLARLGYYDGLKFHRIIKGFMAQGGCPLGTGTGGPGYMIDGEFFGTRKHDKPGVLSTANTGMPKTDGSQFFLTFVPTPHLDGKHTIWGEVVQGMDAVKGLEAAGTGDDNRMAEPPTIVRSWIQVTKSDKDKDKDGGKAQGEDKGEQDGKGEHGGAPTPR
jgi:cyclophilin family peptidyl-prolyl cis-trans isomerase